MKSISKIFIAVTVGIALNVFTIGIASALVPVEAGKHHGGTTIIIKVHPEHQKSQLGTGDRLKH